jgi:hypothetical protein
MLRIIKSQTCEIKTDKKPNWKNMHLKKIKEIEASMSHHKSIFLLITFFLFHGK